MMRAIVIMVMGALGMVQAQECQVEDGMLSHMLSTLQAQAALQETIINRMQVLQAYLDVPYTAPASLSVAVDPGYAGVLGDHSNAWQDGVISGDELSSDAEAAALVAAFQDSIGSQLGVDPDRVVVTGITQADMSGGRRLQEGTGKEILTIEYGTMRA